VWLALALPAILLLAVFASIVTMASVPIAAKVVIGLCLIPLVALTLRTMFGFDLTVTERQLIYRAAFHTYRIDRSMVARVSVEDSSNSWGANNLKVVNIHRTDGTTVELKLFGSFRPSETTPEPAGYRRMQTMAQDLTSWAESSPSRTAVQ